MSFPVFWFGLRTHRTLSYIQYQLAFAPKEGERGGETEGEEIGSDWSQRRAVKTSWCVKGVYVSRQAAVTEGRVLWQSQFGEDLGWEECPPLAETPPPSPASVEVELRGVVGSRPESDKLWAARMFGVDLAAAAGREGGGKRYDLYVEFSLQESDSGGGKGLFSQRAVAPKGDNDVGVGERSGD